MQIFKKVLGIIVTIIMWSILAITVLLMVFMVASKASGKQPSIFGFGLYQIVSGSMEPEIKVGDVVIGKKVDSAKIAVGDNIIFKYGNIIVTHKVIELNADGSFTTHGIANASGANERVEPQNILARQVFKVGGLGYALNFLRSPFGFIFIIALPIGGLVIYQTVSLGRRLKEYASDEADCVSIKEEISELKSRLKEEDVTLENAETNAEIKKDDTKNS